MKKVLIVLLFSLAFANLHAQSNWSKLLRETTQENDLKGTIIGDLIEYSQKCYNDSILTTILVPDPSGYINLGVTVTPAIYKYPQYKTIWIHKEPTFEGFIEFIKIKQSNK